MTRVNAYDGAVLVGWFDPDAAIGYAPRDRDQRGILYHTRTGKWALTSTGEGPTCRFITPEQATEWLLNEGYEETLVRQAMEALPNGPGRPEVGPAVQVRLTPDTLARLDTISSAVGKTRAALIREAVDAFLEGAYVTKAGRLLTDAEIEALSQEAERGYDVVHLMRPVEPEYRKWARVIDHPACPDDDLGPPRRCKECEQVVVWVGGGEAWQHATNDEPNVQFPECGVCGARSGQAHDPACTERSPDAASD